MNMKLSGFFTLLLLSSLQSFAQDHDERQYHRHSPAIPKSIILYDPLFWKAELKLSSVQQNKIDKINIEFYQSIKQAITKKESLHTQEIAKLLMRRSDQIWETFHENQKRKWEKLDEVNLFFDVSEDTQNSL